MTSPEKQSTPETLPKIWYTRILTDVEVMHEANCIMVQNDVHDRLRFQGHYELWEDDSGGNVPTGIRFRHGRKQIKKSTPDAFCIFGGYLIISRKFRDVLMEFDLGASEFIELPIYEEDGTTPTKYPPHYLLHVKSTKPTLIPEESKNIKKPIPPGATEPLPEARWGQTYVPDELAVRASSAPGADLWADVTLHYRLFLSDRLKQAIESAGVKSKGLKFVEARVLP